jgi:formate/nitrite transporter FocA (FNT family)
VSALAAYGEVQPQDILTGMVEVSKNLQERTGFETLLQAIPAGFIIASVAWIRSAEDQVGFPIVLVLTLAISLCGFAHVVAGATEAFLLMWTGHADFGWVLAGFLLPALAGNIIGGTGLFAVLAHAQVKEEI